MSVVEPTPGSAAAREQGCTCPTEREEEERDMDTVEELRSALHTHIHGICKSAGICDYLIDDLDGRYDEPTVRLHDSSYDAQIGEYYMPGQDTPQVGYIVTRSTWVPGIHMRRDGTGEPDTVDVEELLETTDAFSAAAKLVEGYVNECVERYGQLLADRAEYEFYAQESAIGQGREEEHTDGLEPESTSRGRA